ncbi:MAG: tRNA (adenosine(37)-N6)-threonylcarbamoyltransferase complex dimerization subunit type 1 TsaB [Planctomycetes bacterium]|nr:tRNA (adenosine(37)-N6)-threonylcarbamoyltransferase complex dimerization subunit type 1 TsaB [Planctomycetota bacterium]
MQRTVENPSFCALAIETSSEHGSVAVGRGRSILATQQFSRPQIHIGAFVPAIREVCGEAGVKSQEIAEIYVSHGPGSFTGLRLGVTAARTIAFACGSRLVAVPTLEAIANHALELATPPAEIVVILDAKRGHVYAQSFKCDNGRIQPADEEAEVEPNQYLLGRGANWGIMGAGIASHREAVLTSGGIILPEHLYQPRAEIVYQLGFERSRRSEFVDRRSFTPLYVRPPEAEERWEARHR